MGEKQFMDISGAAIFLNKILDAVYPIGSIYISINKVDPDSLFGGMWERIEDTFLLASGSTYTAGSTGGEAEHTLTVNEIPSHSHEFDNDIITKSTTDGTFTIATGGYFTNTSKLLTASSTIDTGGDQSHNNMPPYLAVYMWKRIS